MRGWLVLVWKHAIQFWFRKTFDVVYDGSHWLCTMYHYDVVNVVSRAFKQCHHSLLSWKKCIKELRQFVHLAIVLFSLSLVTWEVIWKLRTLMLIFHEEKISGESRGNRDMSKNALQEICNRKQHSRPHLKHSEKGSICQTKPHTTFCSLRSQQRYFKSDTQLSRCLSIT